MKKITLFALLLIALGITAKVNAQSLIVTNNTAWAIDITFSALDLSTCNITAIGSVTVNASSTVTLSGPYSSNGIVYKAQGKIGSYTCSVIDCTYNTNTPPCNPPGATYLPTCTI